jgi:predicted phosphoribosyltransferase
MIFRDRVDAGRRLAERLKREGIDEHALVLALPRGGVPVAYEVARALDLPLDVIVVRKLGVPGYEEFAMGAIASGGVRIVNEEVTDALRIPPDAIERIAAREQIELERREARYRNGRPAPVVRDRAVVLIDDGLATGSTMRAAVRALRAQQPRSITVAVPVAAAETCVELRREADAVVCLSTPEPFLGVGRWYADFSQTADEEVERLLERAAAATPSS